MNSRKLLKKLILPASALFLFHLPVFAEGTQLWKQSSYEDFSKGTAKGVAIRSDGRLELAPAFQAIYTSPSPYIWSIVADASEAGAVYIGTGAPARIYRVTRDGKATVIFEPKELQVQSMVMGGNGVLYAATSPDGKVYKIKRRKGATEATGKSIEPGRENTENSGQSLAAAIDLNYTAAPFFDPGTKYIWSLALDREGRLYVGTGDRGEIYRVNPSGEGAIFFKSDETHIRALAFDPNGNLIAGSDGSGLIYRIAQNGEGFVLYSPPKKEITSLAVDTEGNIYAAGVGERRSGFGGAPGIVFPIAPALPAVQPGGGAPAAPALPAIPFPGGLAPASASGSEIYMIATDGSPKQLWSVKEDIVYAMNFDAQGRLLAGTGNKGRIVAIEKNGDFSDLLNATANQVTGFAPAPQGGIYISTSNLGKIFLLGPSTDGEATYESDVFDARIFSQWGRAEVRGSGNFEFFARSGNVDNPDRNWSPWNQVNLAKDAAPDVPAARFFQWKAVMKPGGPPPSLESVAINYRPKNLAPVVDEIAVQPGARFTPAPPGRPAETIMVSLSKPSNSGTTAQPRQDFAGVVPAQIAPGSIAVRWSAHDENDDDLRFSIYYRGDGESRWKLLRDNLTDRLYSWDSGLLPDGGYTLRVVASDAPSHTPDEALTDSRDSARFEVDSTPPRVESLAATQVGGKLHITFRGMDTFSPIKRAEYSIDAGEWRLVEPVGLLSDSQTENYDFEVPVEQPATLTATISQSDAGQKGLAKNRRPGTSAIAGEAGAPDASIEHTVVVRVYDRFENAGTAKVVVK